MRQATASLEEAANSLAQQQAEEAELEAAAAAEEEEEEPAVVVTTEEVPPEEPRKPPSYEAHILKEEGSGYQVRLVRNAPPGSYGAKVGSVTRPDGSKGYGIKLFVTARPSEAEQLIQP